MSKMQKSSKNKTQQNNDGLDALAAVVLIGVAVVGIIYWLHGLAS